MVRKSAEAPRPLKEMGMDHGGNLDSGSYSVGLGLGESLTRHGQSQTRDLVGADARIWVAVASTCLAG